MENTIEFVKTLPSRIQRNDDLSEYKKDIIKNLLDYIRNDQDIVIQPDGRRIKTSAVLITQLWNGFYEN